VQAERQAKVRRGGVEQTTHLLMAAGAVALVAWASLRLRLAAMAVQGYQMLIVGRLLSMVAAVAAAGLPARGLAARAAAARGQSVRTRQRLERSIQAAGAAGAVII
jgi:hypothetical protein